MSPRRGCTGCTKVADADLSKTLKSMQTMASRNRRLGRAFCRFGRGQGAEDDADKGETHDLPSSEPHAIVLGSGGQLLLPLHPST